MEIHASELNTNGFPPRKFKRIYFLFIIAVAFFLGVQAGRADLKDIPLVREFVDRNRDNAPREVNWQLLWDAIDKIQEKYVNRPADMQKILYGAVSGAVASLEDPYSVFLPPSDAKELKDELEGKLSGIGAEIAIKHQQLVVVSPIDDSPAIKAGIKPGDYIQKVDGQETRNLTLAEAVKKIRGEAGTKVMLTVFHKGATESVDIEIIRAEIEIKSVSGEIKEANGKKIGHIELRRFGDDTQGELQKVIDDFLIRGVNGVILDVRNNPGGYLETAVEVTGNWLESGKTVVVQKFGDETEKIYEAHGNNKLAKIPTAVLINGGSASASEIVAGALQDHGIAKLVGEKSFGKGSVQELLELRDDAELKITIAKWLTPKGHDLNKEGLEPDEKIELKDEDFQADRDPQLDRALELLTK